MTHHDPTQSQAFGFSKFQSLRVFADTVAFLAVYAWPALKTFAGMTHKPPHHLGRWSMYWIAIPMVYIVYRILHFLFGSLFWFPFAEIILALAASWSNGHLVRRLSSTVVAPFYGNHYDDLRRLPEQIPGYVATGFRYILRLFRS
jgi:hypothetical protein